MNFFSFEFSTLIIMSSVNKGSFISFFLVCKLLFPFLDLARTSSTMWKRSGEKGCPCFLPDLRGKDSSYSPFFYVF